MAITSGIGDLISGGGNFLENLLRSTKPGRAYTSMEQRSALKDLAGQMQNDGVTGQMTPFDRQSALLKYAQITGDMNPMFGIGQDTPSDIRTYQFYNSLTPEERKNFLTVKRAAQIVDQGGYNKILDPLNPQGGEGGVLPKTLAPENLPETRGAQALAAAAGGVAGTKTEEERQKLKTLEAGVPSLKDAIKQASDAAKEATYTKAGTVYDVLAQELFGKTTEGSLAKADFRSIIENTIIPQLRSLLGAQFTEKDREAVTAMMGDTNATPKQKEMQLNNFMMQRMRDIETAKLRVGEQPTQEHADEVFSGVNPKNPPNLPKEGGTVTRWIVKDGKLVKQ